MTLKNIIDALRSEKLSAGQFYEFFRAYNLQNHPLIQDVIQELMLSETNDGNVVNDWTLEDMNALLDMLADQPDEFELSHSADSALHEWSVEDMNTILKMLPAHDSEDVTPSTQRENTNRYGKTHVCQRCNLRFKSYDEYASHRTTHTVSAPHDSETAGPSGTQSITRRSRSPVTTSLINDDSQSTDDEIDAYSIERTGIRQFAKSSATETTYKVKFGDRWQGRRLVDMRNQLGNLFEDVLKSAKQQVNENDMLRIVIRHHDLNHHIVVPLQAAGGVTANMILSKAENVIQSAESLAVDESFQVIVGTIHIPQGVGRRRITKLFGPDNSISKKSSMVQIVNDDKLCMARAIGVCLAKQCVVTEEEWKPFKNDHRHLTNPEILLRHRKCSVHSFKSIINKKRPEQKDVATLLCELAKVPTDRTGSLNDIPAFEEACKMRIAVVAASLGNKFIRVPNDQHENWPLMCLYLVDHRGVSHFHAVTNITGFFSARYFCERCLKPYDHNTQHRCESTCLTCKNQNCQEKDDAMTCRACHMNCRSIECFQRHFVKKTRMNNGNELNISQCDKFWRCTACKKVVNRLKRPVESHKCDEWLCKCCRSWVCGEHCCFLFPDEPKQPVKRFIFFDFEATQDTLAQCNEGYLPDDTSKCQRCFKSWCGQPRHVPNFVVAQTVCEVCEEEELKPDSTCDMCGNRCSTCDARDPESNTFIQAPCLGTCGSREVIFQGDNTLEEFGNWLFSHKDVTVIAHNMKGYDGMFLLEYLVGHSIRPSKVIYNGSKIMYMEVSKGLKIRVVDSLNFLPMKLADLPKTFGLRELCKGYFPHLFNVRENQRYVGTYPDPSFYGAKFMSIKDREEFLLWHEGQRGAVFDFRKEIETYCRSDVDILRRACLQFRQLMIFATGVDPFQYITIASVCMAIYKTRFLEADFKVHLDYPEGTIGPSKVKAKKTQNGWLEYDRRSDTWEPLRPGVKISKKLAIQSALAQVSSEGYVRRHTYSKASIQWLEYQMEIARREGKTLQILHALNGGEVTILGTRYKVDGLAENIIYEFHGCLWHGCLQCYPDRTAKNPKTGQSMEQLYALTLMKKRILTIEEGYQYVHIWEHDWTRQVREDPDVMDFVAGLDLQDRLDPRESFFGGRTNAVKLHYKIKDDERIKYVDFTSLYPYVNKYGKYPVGHPDIITDGFNDIESYFGIAKVKIIAPRGLYHPVLPYRSNGKLKFPLCRTCADEERRTVCRCTDEMRAFVGTWCTPEILKALDKGYQVLKIYEVYHWTQSTQYDRKTGTGGLFASYVNTFLKFKQEASGWPEWCETLDDKEKYVYDYLKNEGVQLDPRNVKKNPGLRALAKLCLNSFWGKFGQRLNQGVCEYIHASQLDKFYKLLTDRSKKVTDFHIINEEHLHLEYEHQSGFVPEDMKTNIFLATFTTCWARLKLYDVLDSLADRVLYYDTDSVIFVSRPGQSEPPLGDYLGDLTNELKPNDYIVEFASGGPKNYAYITANGDQTCKIRGFSLNYAGSQLLNFESVRDIVGHVNPSDPRTYKKRGLDDDEQPPSKVIVVTNPSKISRDKYNNVLYNRTENKRYRVVYDKRVIRDNYDTVPYGYH